MKHKVNQSDPKTARYKIKERLIQYSDVILILGFLVLIVYANSLGNDFVSDDITGIVKNLKIGSLNYFTQNVFVYPSRKIVYSLSYILGGKNPIIFRLPVVITHFINSLLVFVIFYKLRSKTFGLTVASVFAVHPAIAESIVWISAGSYVYGAFFVLASYIAYTFYDTKVSRIISLVSYFAAISFSMFCVFLPVAFLIQETLDKSLVRNWKKLVPFFLAVLFASVFGTYLLTSRIFQIASVFGNRLVVSNPIETIPYVISTYIELLLWPQNLTFYHSDLGFSFFGYSTIVFNQTAKILKLIVFLSFSATYFYSYFKNKFIFFWLSFFILSIAITLTPLAISAYVAERYFYIGIIGLIAAVLELLFNIFKRQSNGLVLFLWIIIILFGVRTFARNRNWKNEYTLWASASEISPSSYQNHNNLGAMYFAQGDLESAESEFINSINLNPNFSDSLSNLSLLYYTKSDYDKAIEYSDKALAVNPNSWQAHLVTAASFQKTERLDDAKYHAQISARLNPNNKDPLVILAQVSIEQEEFDKAVEISKVILRLDPGDTFARQIIENSNNN